MRYPEHLLTEGEEVVREFRPHWRLLVIPVGWIVLAIVAGVLTWNLPPENDLFDWIVVAAVAVAAFPLGIYPLIAWWFTGYVLTNERLIFRRGVLARKGIEIPLENINDLQFSQTILERVLRSGDLLIESAGEQGQSRFRDIPDPEQFQSLVYRAREQRAVDLSGGPSVANDETARLQRLGKMFKEGLLTEEEFEEAKRKLLDEL